MSETLILKAQNNLHSLVSIAFNYTDKERAVVVYDTDCLLSTLLMQGYKRALPNALLIDFNASAPEEILTIFDSLHPFDLVILIQSKSFRLNEFRLRVELFKKQIKVIEHPHLSRMSDDEAEYYIDSLAYDADYYRGVGRGLKAKIDAAPMGIIDSGGELLIYDTPFEPAKLNIGDYSDMPNTGGQFPLGEVFTEAQDLRALYGRAKIFCFGDVTYKLNTPATPITIIVEEGQVI
ncbi:MAG: hypothetical protein WCW84_11295, partial [Sulfurimonas sp.]